MNKFPPLKPIRLLGCHCPKCRLQNERLLALAAYKGIPTLVSHLDPHKYHVHNG